MSLAWTAVASDEFDEHTYHLSVYESPPLQRRQPSLHEPVNEACHWRIDYVVEAFLKGHTNFGSGCIPAHTHHTSQIGPKFRQDPPQYSACSPAKLNSPRSQELSTTQPQFNHVNYQLPTPARRPHESLSDYFEPCDSESAIRFLMRHRDVEKSQPEDTGVMPGALVASDGPPDLPGDLRQVE